MCKVSVIINCLNGEKYLNETLQSVKEQTFKDYEIVFWDNCSSDKTGEIAKSFGDQLKYYCGERTVPLGEARNYAIEKATGDYIAFLDSDDIWEPRKLELQVGELDNNPSIGLVCSNYCLNNNMVNKTWLYDKKPFRRIMDFSAFIDHYNYCFSTFMIRKKSLEGLYYIFSNELRYAEEFDLFARIALNWEVLYLPMPLVTYRIHSAMNSMHLIEVQFDEYNSILKTLREIKLDFDEEYPNVVKWISFLRDLARTKDIIRKGNNKEVRELMKPYLNYNIRAKCFYCISFLPETLSKQIVNSFYGKRF